MKRFYKIFSSWFLCLFLVLSQFIVSFADVNSLMINSSSNALMTLELDDDLMMMSTRSSLASIKNTVDYSHVKYIVVLVDVETGMQRWDYYFVNSDGSLRYYVPDGYVMIGYGFDISKGGLPSGGNYRFRADFSSDVSLDYDDCALNAVYRANNVEQLIVGDNHYSGYIQSSGDFYFDETIKFTNPSFLELNIWIGRDLVAGNLFAGSVKFNFASSDSFNLNLSPSGNGFEPDYNLEVSDSLSDISSSVDSMTEDLSSAAENLEYISTSQNLIIQGIDNVVMHISDQLFAFWNQLFNLIHVPTMAKMDDIISAIQNMDLEIEVNLDGLKQSIHQASQNEIANDNKISDDQIANDEANTEEVKEAVKEHGNFIIDGLKGLFIPSDEFFKAYFDDLYAYFSDRFGFLSFPIDLVIRIADLFLTSEKVDAVLTLPSFEISGYKVWDDYSFNFTEFLETSFPFLISAIQTVTSIGLIMAFVNLCQDKWNEVMRS